MNENLLPSIPSATTSSHSTTRHLVVAASGAAPTLGSDGTTSPTCTITVTLDASEISGCGNDKISGTAKASNSLCQVTVPIPGERPVTGIGSVSFSYYPTTEDLGTTVTVWAYESENCTPGSADVDILDVDFEVERWEPTIEDAANVDTTFRHNNVPLAIEVPYMANSARGSLFEVEAKVTIVTKPASSSEIADACCAEWGVEIIRNIVGFGVRRSTYFNSTWTTALAKVPCLDDGMGMNEISPFEKANDEVTLKMGDTPGFSSSGVTCFDSAPGDLLPNPISLVEDNVTFITWLTVVNKDTNERRFLQWVRWSTQWSLSVTVPPGAAWPAPLPTVAWRDKLFMIVDQGDGEGSEEAVFNKLKPTTTRIPPPPPPQP